MYCTPGPDNSSLINTENAVPNNPENSAKIRYNVPISFALLDRNQRSHHIEILDFCNNVLLALLLIYLFDSMLEILDVEKE